MPPSAGRSSIGVRVRPNSHDFIRDLRTDLKAKQATFYVDVKAKTAQATRDVVKWKNGPLQGIKASINVTANLNAATREVNTWRRTVQANSATIKLKADTSQATEQVRVWREIAGRDLTIRVRADTSNLGLASLKRNLDTDAKVRVKADTVQAKREIKALDDDYGLFTVEVDADTKKAKLKVREVFDEVKGEQLEMDLGLNTTPAVAKAKAAKARIEQDPVRAQLDLDTRRAKLRLTELRIEAAARKLKVDVEVKKSGVDSFHDSLKSIEKSFGNFTFFRSLSLGPVNLGKPTGLIGTVASITALAGAVPGAVLALTSLAKVLTQVAGAASIAPGAIGVLAASMATISVGSLGVSDAFSSMFDLWNEGASAQQSSASSLVSAHNSYRNAVVDEAKAQRDVGRARRDALGDLRSLNNELRGGVLNEAQAILDVQKARERLAKGGFESGTDQQQAQLDLATSLQRVDEVREQNIKTQQKVNDANVQGVEGSDRVQDALEAQTRAAQATASAAESMNTAMANGTPAATAYAEALARLAPNARDFVTAFSDAKGEVQGFQQDIQNIMFAGTGPAFTDLFHSLLPVIKPGMEGIAKALNSNLLQVFSSLGDPGGQGIIARILGGTEETQKAIGNLIDPLIKGVGTLVAAGSEHLPQVIDLFTRLAERFETFINAADADGSLDKFMNDGVTAMGNMAEIGLNLIKIVNDLGGAFNGDLLTSIKDMTGRWHEFLSSEEGQKKLREFIQKARDIFNEWAPAIEKIPGIIEAASDGAQHIVEILAPFVEKLGWLLEHAPGLVEAFVAAWLGSKFVSGVISPVLAMVKGIASLPGLISKIPAIPGLPGAPGVGPGGAPIAPIGAGATGALGTGIAGAATAGAVALAIPLATGLAINAVTPQDYSISKEDADKQVAEITKSLPPGSPAPDSQEARDIITGLSSQGGGTPAGKWAQEPANITGTAPRVEFAKRYRYLLTHPEAVSDPNFQPPPSYMAGGFTPWGQKDGKLAVLHGKEYVQPADTTAHYGVAAMQAIHEKRVPKEFLQSFSQGVPGFETGGWFDPNDPRNKNPQPGIIDSLVQHGTAGLNSVQFPSVPGATPGQVGVTGAGPLPGPALGAVDALGVASTPATTLNVGPFQIPIGTALPAGGGWGPGGAPAGLGGGPPGPNGEAPFDIRSKGIGPGPVGSGPNDWMNFATGQVGKLAQGIGSELVGGILGGLGLSGVSSYFSAADPLAKHFLDANSATAGGNSDVSGLLSTYYGIPGNPADGSAPGQMPSIFGPGGSAIPSVGAGATGQGLQINTAKGKAIIQRMFPWATNIGGVRPDRLKWHPSGLALDVMIPGQGGNNDPTTPQGLALGNQLYAWLNQHKSELGIDYMMWQVKDHFNHIHVNFAASGYGPGDGSTPSISPPSGGAFNPPGAPSAPAPSRASGESGPPGWGLGGAAKSPLGDLLAGAGLNAQASNPFALPNATRDVGGWLPTGSTIVHNHTGAPEMVLNADQMRSFAAGGYNFPAGLARPIVPPRPTPDFKQMVPRPPPSAAPQPPTAAPKPGIPPITPAAPPMATPPAPVAPGPGGSPIDLTPRGAGPGPGDNSASGDHLNPAVKTGIASAASTIGSAAQTAAGIATMGATGGLGGGLGGGMGGLSIQGLVQQAGKIVSNIANVGASFLVGNVTGGTTENAYGVTQRGSVPSGGTKVVDASQNHTGDIYTNNLDEYFARKRRDDAVAAQSGLGRWGSA